MLAHERGWDPAAFDESPWYAWLEPALAQVRSTGRFPAPEQFTALHREVCAPLGLPPLTFVAAPAKKPRRRVRREPIQLGRLYEGQIVERHEVPTRLDDWHDFFNALAFLAFPRAKWALHARQYRLLRARLSPEARRLPGARTREQDALSLFDEGGIGLAVEPAVLARCGQPGEEGLPRWTADGLARAVPFGHALFEHLVAGKQTLGTVQVVPLSQHGLGRLSLRDALDSRLASMLEDPAHFTAPSGARGVPLTRLTA